jgi:arsenate reductase-like glutaredoxin family protein
MQDCYRCLEITVLKKQPRSDEAKQLLERVAKQVQPIMRKRQWTVKKVLLQLQTRTYSQQLDSPTLHDLFLSL